MPLRHVLYRCPRCGHDPTEGRGDRVACQACGTEYRRARRGVEVEAPDGTTAVESVADLVAAIDRLGGALSAATDPQGRLTYTSRAAYHGFLAEDALHVDERLLGFVERPGKPVEGVLELDAACLVFRGGGAVHRWDVADITALQVSTRSLQVGVRKAGTFQVTLRGASTLRWEMLLQHAIRACWRERGWGAVTEFQPRITGR